MKLKFNIHQAVVLGLALGLAVGLVAAVGSPAFAALQQSVCPQGGDWSGHQDPPFSPVDGAVEYCFKAGSDNSEGCEGGLFDSWPQPEGTCGLSHWSYRLGTPTQPPPTRTPDPTPPDDTPTPTEVPPTETPTDVPPTPTPTDDPRVTPTPTEPPCEECEPTPTPTDPPEPTPTPTDPPEVTPTPTNPPDPKPTPTELPKTGANDELPTTADPFTWEPAAWQEEGYPDNLWLTHNGHSTAGFGDQIVMLQRGATFAHHALGSSDYEVTGVMKVEATDTWIVDTIRASDELVVMTCSGYNLTTGEWKYRVIVFLQELP